MLPRIASGSTSRIIAAAFRQGAVEDMFLPFKQSGEDRSGLGLGLAICRRSVEANNGVLSVRDVAGSGCVFTIALPRHCW